MTDPNPRHGTVVASTSVPAPCPVPGFGDHYVVAWVRSDGATEQVLVDAERVDAGTSGRIERRTIETDDDALEFDVFVRAEGETA